MPPFDTTIACGADSELPGARRARPGHHLRALEDQCFPREVPLSIPVNPGLLPSTARLRHLVVAYSGPAFQKPRTIPVADAHVRAGRRQVGADVQGAAPRHLPGRRAGGRGHQAFKRRLTHRAVIGVSMGGGGTAMFGMRHHDLFDVIAPLGGPVDWTWLLDYIENNHLGGFRPIAKGTTLADIQLAADDVHDERRRASPTRRASAPCARPMTPGKCMLMPKATDPYVHPQTFNNWWYEYPRAGNGGSFARDDYAQIFRDLALMFGNPNGDNLAPGGENLPAGVPPDDKSVVGDHPGSECAVWVDPIDCPRTDGNADTAEKRSSRRSTTTARTSAARTRSRSRTTSTTSTTPTASSR